MDDARRRVDAAYGTPAAFGRLELVRRGSQAVAREPDHERRRRLSVAYEPVDEPAVVEQPLREFREAGGEALHLEYLGAFVIRGERIWALLVVVVTAGRVPCFPELGDDAGDLLAGLVSGDELAPLHQLLGLEEVGAATDELFLHAEMDIDRGC